MFNGWFTSLVGGTQVDKSKEYSSDTTLYAQWTYVPLTVTFNAQSGVVEPTSGVTKEDGTLSITLPTPTRDGYTFKGWFTTASGNTSVEQSRVYTATTTIYAQWTINVYTVTYQQIYDIDGETLLNPQPTEQVEHGNNVTLTPTRLGYTFNGFEYGNGNAFNDKITYNATLVAQWELIPVEPTSIEINTVTSDETFTSDYTVTNN